MNLADEVEELFIKHFAEEDRRKAMKYLKPTQRKESHSVTFFIGKSMPVYNKLGMMNIILIKLKYPSGFPLHIFCWGA